MNTTSARTWYIAAAVVAVLLLVAGWFLAVAPAKSTAAELNEQAAQVQSQNDSTRAEIAQLQAQSKDLPAQEQRIAEIRQRIPASPALPSLVRELDSRADTAGVVLVSVTPGPPVAGPDLSTIPLEIKVTGEFANVRAYMNQLETMNRSYFVTGLNIALDPGATSSKTTELGATITGSVYTAAVAPAVAPAPAPAPAAG
jgi:type IV pilus assembly protein PilO